jgi:hypothetical protein
VSAQSSLLSTESLHSLIFLQSFADFTVFAGFAVAIELFPVLKGMNAGHTPVKLDDFRK